MKKRTRERWDVFGGIDCVGVAGARDSGKRMLKRAEHHIAYP